MQAIIAERLGRAFNVRQGEGHIVVLLFFFSFLVGFANVYFETAAYAIFITRWGVAELPFVYIGSALLSIAIGTVYHRLESTMSFARLTLLTLGVVSVVVILLRIGLVAAEAMDAERGRWAALILLMWSEVFYMLTGIMFWNLAGRLLNLRQGKRLFGLVSSGDVIAGVIGGLSIGFLNRLFPTANQLFIVAVSFVSCLILMIYIGRRYAEQLAHDVEDDEDEQTTKRVRAGRRRYLFLLFGMVTLSIFAYYYLDYAFVDLLENRFRVCPESGPVVPESAPAANQQPGFGTGLGDSGCPPTASGEQPPGEIDQEQLAGFLGFFNAAVGLVNIIFKTLISGRLINRFGMTLGLLFLPVMVTSGILVAVLTDWISGDVGVLIWVVVVVKLLDKVARESIDDSATVILYQPLPRDQRLRMQTIVESFAEPTATIFAGGSLLILTSETVGFGAGQLLLVVLLMILGVWISTSVVLRRQYITILSEALAKRTLGSGLLMINDPASLKLLNEKASTQNDSVGEVIYALEMLEECNARQLEAKLAEMLEHPAVEVRLDMLRRIERLGLSSLMPAIIRLLGREETARIRGAALRTLASFGDADVYEQLAPNLKSPELEVRRGAMVGLLRGGGIEGVLDAGAQLTQLAASEQATDRRFAAEVLGDVGIRNFYRPLVTLFDDENLEVRKAALGAAGKLGNARLWPRLVESLGILQLKTVAAGALANAGEAAIPEMCKAFRQESQSRDVKVRIVRILAQIRSDTAIRFLLEQLDVTDSQVRHQIFKSLNRMKFTAQSKEDQERVGGALRREAGNATWVLACLVDLSALASSSLLIASLTVQLAEIRDRLFLLLGMLYSHYSMMQIKTNYESGVDEKRSYAVELLDNVVRQEFKEMVLPLLEDIPNPQRLSRLSPIFNPARLTFQERLKNLIVNGVGQSSFWTVSCALYEVGITEDADYGGAVATALNSSDPVIRETALWSLGRLHPEDLATRLEPHTHDRARNVAIMARYVMDTVALGTVTARSPYMKRAGQHEIRQLSGVLMNPEERPVRRRQIVKILAAHGGALAFKALLDGLYVADKQVQAAVFDALRRYDYDLSDRHKDLLEVMSRELADVEYMLSAQRGLSLVPGFERLILALAEGVFRARLRVLKNLALLGAAHSYGDISYWYGIPGISHIPEPARVQAVDSCQVIGDPALRNKVEVLFSRRQVQPRHWEGLEQARSVEELLVDMALAQTRWFEPWIRVCALERLVDLELSQYAPGIANCLRDPNDVVRQTAIWALSRLAPALCQQHLRDLSLDPSTLVAATVEDLIHQRDAPSGPGVGLLAAPARR